MVIVFMACITYAAVRNTEKYIRIVTFQPDQCPAVISLAIHP